MQFAKDSFYMTLRKRLAALNSQRTVILDGLTQPAILVSENERVTTNAVADCFHLSFGKATPVSVTRGQVGQLIAVECAVQYSTRGISPDHANRGRSLAVLDTELLAICVPPRDTKRDYTQAPPAELGTSIFWSEPQLAEVKDDGRELTRSATLTLFFFAEEKA